MGKTARKSAQVAYKQNGPAAKKPAAKKVARWNGVPILKDDRREAILRSVANVLRNSRLSSLTIKQVADELGMTKGNLYYYFKDKQDILYHCHMRSVENSLRALSEARALGHTPSEKLRILLVRHIRAIIDDGFGGINWIPKWYRPSGPFTSAEISEHMADYYLRGLRSGAGAAEQAAPSLKFENERNRLAGNNCHARRGGHACE